VSGVVGIFLTVGSGFSLVFDISLIWTLDFSFLIYFGSVAKTSKVLEGLVFAL